MTVILLVGAADTGRAPMAAALLRRLLGARGYAWAVESTGVLGHDGAAAEVEARDTMVHMGLDIGAHQARLIDEAQVAAAALLITLDRGTALVLHARFPNAVARIHSLGELAGRARDIPDPFRMQIGAWMTYAREIDGLLEAALPRVVELTGQGSGVRGQGSGDLPLVSTLQPLAAGLPEERIAAVGRISQLLQLAAQMPGVIAWPAGRAQIAADLTQIVATPAAPDDLVLAYVGLLRAALALLQNTPSAQQLAALQTMAAPLAAPIGQDALNELSAQIVALPSML